MVPVIHACRVSLLETSLRKQKISELRANARAMIMQKALFSRLHYVMGAGLAISVGSEVCDLFLREALHGSYKLDYGAFGIVSSVVFSAMYSLVGGWMLFRSVSAEGRCRRHTTAASADELASLQPGLVVQTSCQHLRQPFRATCCNPKRQQRLSYELNPPVPVGGLTVMVAG